MQLKEQPVSAVGGAGMSGRVVPTKPVLERAARMLAVDESRVVLRRCAADDEPGAPPEMHTVHVLMCMCSRAHVLMCSPAHVLTCSPAHALLVIRHLGASVAVSQRTA